MKYIPIAYCGVCPYAQGNKIITDIVQCTAMKGDNDITFSVENNIVPQECPLPDTEEVDDDETLAEEPEDGSEG